MKQLLIPSEKECRSTLKMWREDDITIKMISENLEVSQQTVIRWLKGAKISTNSRIKFSKFSADIARAKNQVVPLIL